MEVILIKPVRKLGKISELVKVKDGFARNHLLPQKLAIRATEKNKEQMIKQKEEWDAKNLSAKAEAERIAQIIHGKDLIFIRQSSDDGKLFGSVNNKEIAKELSMVSGYEIPYNAVLLESHIKHKGVTAVEVSLHPEVSVYITVIVARSENEAQDVIKAHNAPSEINSETPSI